MCATGLPILGQSSHRPSGFHPLDFAAQELLGQFSRQKRIQLQRQKRLDIFCLQSILNVFCCDKNKFGTFGGDIMRRWLCALGMFCAASPLGCTRTDPAELAKARADTEAAKAEATKARAEADGFRAKNAGGGTAPPSVNPTTKSVTKGGLDGAGVAVFPGGKKSPFTNIWNAAKDGPFIGSPEVELPYFEFQEILPQNGRNEMYFKVRKVSLSSLSSIRFGPKKLHPVVRDSFIKENYYCDLELEAMGGQKESFPCSLEYNNLAISVQYADRIAKEKLEANDLYDITFRARE